MNKQDIKSIKFTGHPNEAFNGIVFIVDGISLDGSLTLKNVLNGRFVTIYADGINGIMGTYHGGIPLPTYTAQYGFSLAESFNLHTFTTLRDLTTEESLACPDCMVLVHENVFKNKLKLSVPALSDYHEKTFVKGTNNGLTQIYTREDAPEFYLQFSIELGDFMLMVSGSQHTRYQYDINETIESDIDYLNANALNFTPNYSIVFSEPVPVFFPGGVNFIPQPCFKRGK